MTMQEFAPVTRLECDLLVRQECDPVTTQECDPVTRQECNPETRQKCDSKTGTRHEYTYHIESMCTAVMTDEGSVL